MSSTEQDAGRLRLARRVLLGLLLGIATGLVFGELVGWLQTIGDIFIRLLQITVIPYISLALITGLGSLDFEQVRRIALRGGIVLILIWSITLALVLLIPLAFPDWSSGSFFNASLTRTAPSPDFLRLFIPSNPFFAFANAIVPAVVVFSVLLGLALIRVPQREAILDPLTAIRDALMQVTSSISRLAPYGVFALIAATIGKFDIQDLVRLQVYIVLYGLSALVLAFWVLPALISAFTPLSYWTIMRALRIPMLTAFATGSTLVVLPMVIDACKELTSESEALSSEAREEADTSVGVMVPTFYPPPSAGSVLVLSFMLYAGWYVGSSVPSSDYSTLVLAGIPTLFGGTFLTVSSMLDMLRLPSDMFQVFVAVDAITSRFGTLVGSVHYATIGLIGTFALVRKPTVRLRELAMLIGGSLALAAVLFFGVRLMYGAIAIVPDAKANALRNLALSGVSRPVIDYQASLREYGKPTRPASFARILERGVLRVCYQPNEYPSAFYNTREPPQLVGFDIDMAHRFANRRELQLALLPTPTEAAAAANLNSGACDIYMRSLPVSAGRSLQFGLTRPIYHSTLALIVEDYRREEFQDWEQLRQAGDEINIAVEATTESVGMVREALPEAKITPIKDMSSRVAVMATVDQQIDAVADMAEEAAAHTLFYPQYRVVVPQPHISVPVAYAVAYDNRNLLVAIDAWLMAEAAKGTVDTLYEHWMLGGAVERDRPPPWSVVRNVLGWVE